MGLRVLLAVLLAVQLGLNVAFVVGLQLAPVPKLVDLDQEANLSAWWSSILLAALALLATGLAWADEARGRKPLWIIAALLFTYLSLDEVAGIHERLGVEIGGDDPGDLGSRAWVFILGPILLLAAAALARLAGALSPAQRTLVVTGVACYAFALLTELVSIWSSDAGDRVGVFIEENAEILGSNLILVGLLGALLQRAAVSRRP